MPTYEHKCDACEHEWEDLYGMQDPVPDKCPECGAKGKVKRLISWCSGTVELTGHEHIAKLKEDGRKMAKEARKNENLMANLVGESKYNGR